MSLRLPPPSLRPVVAALAAAAGLVGAVTSSGCTLSPKPPSVSAVEPAWGYNGETTTVEIVGAHFFPTVVVDEGDGGRVEGGFQAWLEGEGEPLRLRGVQHLSYERLEADIPAGLDPGVYDLRVEVPAGLTALLPGAFTVTDTRADHLEIELDDVAFEVGIYADVVFSLKDPADKPVAQELEVEVVASPASDHDSVADVAFIEGFLRDQTPLEDEVGVRGFLAADGEGHVFVTSTTEAAVELTVRPAGGGVVREATQIVAWDPGPVDNVVLELPEAGFETVAGETFDLGIRLQDRLGNALPGAAVDVRLFDACGTTLDEFVQVVGETTVEVTLVTACPENRVYARYGGDTFESEPFAVHPAPLAGYTVEAYRDPVVAGEHMLLFVEAIDGYGNPIDTHDAELTVTDDVGGLDEEAGVGYEWCSPFGSGVSVCDVSTWTAAPAVVLRVEDADGVFGEAAPIEVIPSDPEEVIVLVAATTVEAGQDFEVVVRLLDAYDNTISFDPLGTEPVDFVDASGTLLCRWLGALEGAQRFSCKITAAEEEADLTAEVLGVVGASEDPLTVTNGPLAFVQLEPLGSSFTAGAAFTLELRGFDAHGNPYIVQTDPLVTLSASTGTMTPSSTLLDAEGAAQVTAVLYGAGESVRVYAAQGGLRLGASRPLPVTAAALDALDVDAPPWIDVDQPGVVYLSAVDAYGNHVDSYAGTVTIEAREGSCDPVVVDTFSGGGARVEVACDTPTLAETLVALDDDGYGGESGDLDVVDLGCADGPAASLLLDGRDEAVLCLTEGGTVDVAADTSGSVAGGASIVARHVIDGESIEQRTEEADLTLAYDEPGVRRVQALVVDADACADHADAFVYVGRADGEPTGPVEVEVSASSADTFTDVTVSVAARDCTGDLAADQEVVVRADLGTPDGTSSGAGLVVPLDGLGEGSFTWSFDTGYDGTATLYVSSAGGGAFGSATVEVTEDAALPELVSVDPAGRTLDEVDALTVVFTEPLRSWNVTSATFALAGPSGPIEATLSLSDDLETVTVTPDEPLDGAAGAYTLTLSTNVRDLAGNQLDGEWTDVAAPLSLRFGDVEDTLPTVSSCEADRSRFIPDGDAGHAGEADAVTVTPTATAAPTWWWLVVTGPDGARVRSAREPGATGKITWDGRGDDGVIAPAAKYRLRTRAIDENGNVGEACDVVVELEQRVEPR